MKIIIHIIFGVAVVALADIWGDKSENVAIVLYGPSQSAKTTFACEMLRIENSHAKCPNTGDGSGESVTEFPIPIKTKTLGTILDTPGNDDTQLRFTNEEAGRRVAIGVASADVKEVIFAVFESLANDRMELRKTLSSLVISFGNEIISSVVIVATKLDCCPKDRNEKRLSLIRDVMQSNEIQELVILGPEDTIKSQQAEITRSFSRVQPTATYDLRDLWSRQSVLAQQLCDAHPTQTKVVDVQVDEQYTEPRTVQEAYQEPYVEDKKCVEHYIIKEPYTVQYKCGGRRYGLFGPKRKCNEVRYKDIHKTRQYPCPVTKYRTAHRDKIIHDVKTRKKTVSRSVEYRLPLTNFMQSALNQIIDQIHETFKH